MVSSCCEYKLKAKISLTVIWNIDNDPLVVLYAKRENGETTNI